MAAENGHIKASQEIIDVMERERLASVGIRGTIEGKIEEILKTKYPGKATRGETMSGIIRAKILTELKNVNIDLKDNQLRSYLTRLGYTTPREKRRDPDYVKIGKHSVD